MNTIMYETLNEDDLNDYPLAYESTMDGPRDENLLSDDDEWLDDIARADKANADEEEEHDADNASC